jgi:hypothetical protein
VTPQSDAKTQPPVSPPAYLQQIAQLVAAGSDEEALACSAQHHESVEPHLSLADLERVDGLLESAAMAVSLQQAAGGGTGRGSRRRATAHGRGRPDAALPPQAAETSASWTAPTR